MLWSVNFSGGGVGGSPCFFLGKICVYELLYKNQFGSKDRL